MLPALPSPFPLRRGLVLVGLVLALLLGGCAAAAQPPRGVLLDALALQIHLTQGSIATALGLEEVGLPQVSRVRVEEQETLRIAGAPGLRLAGRFDWRLPSDPIRVDSPFELFLQRGERGQSWRLARPVGRTEGEGGPQQEWLLDPLPLPGERTRA